MQIAIALFPRNTSLDGPRPSHLRERARLHADTPRIYVQQRTIAAVERDMTTQPR
jgi:hypothetical protein